MTIKDYIEGLFSDVPDSEEKHSIMQEIKLNLEEKVADLMEAGKSEEDAINKSIVDFGDAAEIKRDLTAAAHRCAGTDGYNSVIKKKKNYAHRLGYSLIGSALIILLAVFINLYFSPYIIWFVFPTFAVLWWPLTAFFKWLDNRDKKVN